MDARKSVSFAGKPIAISLFRIWLLFLLEFVVRLAVQVSCEHYRMYLLETGLTSHDGPGLNRCFLLLLSSIITFIVMIGAWAHLGTLGCWETLRRQHVWRCIEKAWLGAAKGTGNLLLPRCSILLVDRHWWWIIMTLALLSFHFAITVVTRDDIHGRLLEVSDMVWADNYFSWLHYLQVNITIGWGFLQVERGRSYLCINLTSLGSYHIQLLGLFTFLDRSLSILIHVFSWDRKLKVERSRKIWHECWLCWLPRTFLAQTLHIDALKQLV